MEYFFDWFRFIPETTFYLMRRVLEGGILFLLIVILVLVIFTKKIKIGKNISRICASKFDDINTGYKRRHRKYKKKRIFLSAKGADYLLGREIEPIEFDLLNIVIATLFALVGFSTFTAIGAVIGGIIGYHLVYYLLVISNEQDNKRMLKDIKSVFNTLIIKTQGGQFITVALSHCYKKVKNKRLKSALLDLNSMILVQSDIELALVSFNEKFENKHIDSLCVTIKQSLDSGQMVKSLKDLESAFEEVQAAIDLREQAAIDLKVNILQILVFVSFLLVALYGVFASGNSIFTQL